MEHLTQPSTSQSCAVVMPAFVNPSPTFLNQSEMVAHHKTLIHNSTLPLIPFASAGSPSRLRCLTSSPVHLPHHPPPPIYIAQPININLEVNPKIHLPITTIAPPSAVDTIVTSTRPMTTSIGYFPFLNSIPARPTTLLMASHPIKTAANVSPMQFMTVKAPSLSFPAAVTSLAGVIEGAGDCWNTAVSGWEEATLIKNKIGLVVNQRYKILQSIASGSYGAIFVGEDLWSESKRRVAVKFDAACRDDHLKYEFDVYKSVLYDDGTGKVEGFPRVYWYGHEYGHNILVMELLGAPLASLFAFCDRRFGKETIISLGIQMIERLRHLHRRGFIHRDIKPENFLMGLGERENTCYLIDFGLARRYRFRDNRDLRHIPFRRGRSFVGTAKYASLNSHKGIELSRRDDLESLGYVLIELINSYLPWKHISKRNTAYTRHQTSMKIRTIKEQSAWSDVCPSMAEFISYCRGLPFLHDPDYDHLLKLVRAIDFVERPERVPKPIAEKIRCESCDALVKKAMIPPVNSHIQILPSSLPIVSSQSLSVNAAGMIIDKNAAVISHMPGMSSGNVLCQIPYTLIKPVEDCVASLRSLSIAAAAAATSVNAAASVSGTSLPNPVINTTTLGHGAPALNEHKYVRDEDVNNVTTIIPPDPSVSCAVPASVVVEDIADEDDDSDILISCRRCRERLQQQLLVINDITINNESQEIVQKNDVQNASLSVNNESRDVSTKVCTPNELSEATESASNLLPQQKMSWQVWRESTLDRRFQYENQFSWTLARKSKVSPQKVKSFRKSLQPNFTLDGIEYDMSIPPPPLPNSTNMGMPKPMVHRRRHKSQAKNEMSIVFPTPVIPQPSPATMVVAGSQGKSITLLPQNNVSFTSTNTKPTLPSSHISQTMFNQLCGNRQAVVANIISSPFHAVNIASDMKNSAMRSCLPFSPRQMPPAQFIAPIPTSSLSLLPAEMTQPPPMLQLNNTASTYAPQHVPFVPIMLSNVHPR